MLLYEAHCVVEHTKAHGLVVLMIDGAVVVHPISPALDDRCPHEAHAEFGGDVEHHRSAIAASRCEGEHGGHPMANQRGKAIPQRGACILSAEETGATRAARGKEMQEARAQEFALTGIDKKPRAFMRADMGMRADQAGHHDLAGGIDDAICLCRGAARADVGDLFAADGDFAVLEVAVPRSIEHDRGATADKGGRLVHFVELPVRNRAPRRRNKRPNSSHASPLESM